MTPTAYVTDRFVPEAEACVSIFDRGFLFADGVYEVTTVVDGRPVDLDYHLERLERSLREVRIPPPRPLGEIGELVVETARRNGVGEGRVYLQVTRGAADRDFPFPPGARPTLVLFARQVAVLDSPAARSGIRVCTAPDLRWARRDIKTVMLLPSVLAKQAALDAGYDDAWFVQDGAVTEGTSSNAYIVRDGAVYTHPLSSHILPGCTRRSLVELARQTGIQIVERPFSPEEARAADEAFITSATALVIPVVAIDGHPIGPGRPGPVARRLREIYVGYAREGGR